jgi:hypothetical protein
MSSGAILNGVKDMQRRLEQAAVGLQRRQALALRQEAEIEMTESKKRCPVDVGMLRASGHVQPVEQHGGKTSVDLVYGGAAEDYAIVQHESLDFHHTVGQAKFLESVLMESLPFMGQRIANRMKENAK